MQPLKTVPYTSVVQLSDSHLFAALDGRLLGMDTHDSLRQVIALVEAEQEQVDVLLCTGDISQDGSQSSYQRFAKMVNALGVPMRWFAGNHDERLALQQVCAQTDWLESVYDVGAWRIVLLDSSVVNKVHGELAQDQLDILAQALRSAGDRHVLIGLHHHPVPIHSKWMDKIGLHNAAQMLSIIQQYNNVKAVIWGHVHQEFDQQEHGIRWLAAPSTCVQFTPGSQDFAVDNKAPGYRWLRLYDDGQLQTAVSRVANIDFEIDYSIKGY
ncbi:3',5'-cyclic-AMP phosphodiesterase [Denitrificimonas caeni]|uniref:3',5'-cyclic-AMP phosphodiesterase n=1 Tax=Denitrificimonas caeni TaxID=521720 RepID=A0AAF0AIN3_9GAMM|nr:3',5'-cyclic-AMP phosphodiesterase [Denitrificimonas caeni]WBE25194.1 3',5'-cyclic-AMP phosphodiesterase [Denitrificimonas caeni]